MRDLDLDAGGPLCGHPLDVLEQPAPVRRGLPDVARVPGIDHALEREHDRAGIERRAIVKPHVGAQLERPAQAVGRHLPCGREPRLDVGRARLPPREALEQDLTDLDRLVVDDAHEIEPGDVGRVRDHQRAGIAAVMQAGRSRVAREHGAEEHHHARALRALHSQSLHRSAPAPAIDSRLSLP